MLFMMSLSLPHPCVYESALSEWSSGNKFLHIYSTRKRLAYQCPFMGKRGLSRAVDRCV